MKKIELLSPVGGYEQFIAAVESGADAVYLGGTAFNARNSASNFSEEELKEIIKYAHVRGVKVHLTLNILIHDKEINEAIEFAKRVYSYGIDAFIVQDLGVVGLLKKVIPNAIIHFSTQGTIYSLDGVKAIKELGVDRVVLSRELSLEDIEKICKSGNSEIEVFVHGALCICYSGQCRFSSLIGSRSGNRGKCAQPCRLKYSLYENDKKCSSDYILSPKDLCGIHDLIKLIKSGVTSLKIEGRLKSPEYVAAVTSIYRKYIDLAYQLIENGEESKFKVDEDDIKILLQVFNRGGFSRGYYYNESSKELMTYGRPKHWGIKLGTVLDYNEKRKLVKIKLVDCLNMGDGIEVVNDTLPGNIVTYIEKDNAQVKKGHIGDIVSIGDISGKINKGEDVYKISDKELNSKLKVFNDGKCHKKIIVNMQLSAYVGEYAKLKVSDVDNNEVEIISNEIICEALNRPISFENAYLALAKLGDTPFSLKDLTLNTDGKALVPMSLLNELRKKATEKLIDKRGESFREVSQIKIEKLSENNKNTDIKISVYLYNTKNLNGLEMADRIYIPIENYSEDICEKFKGKEVVPYLPTITKGQKYDDFDVKALLISNIEHLELFRNVENKYCDFSFNVFNSYACDVLKDKFDVKGINLSFELTLDEIKSIETELEKEVTVYGRLPLMVSEHCTIGSEMKGRSNCNLCIKNDYCLEDRTGEKFPLITQREVCRMQVLNSKILFASEVKNELEGKIDYFRAYFFDETTDERRRILKAIKNGDKAVSGKYTSGHFYRGV